MTSNSAPSDSLWRVGIEGLGCLKSILLRETDGRADWCWEVKEACSRGAALKESASTSSHSASFWVGVLTGVSGALVAYLRARAPTGLAGAWSWGPLEVS